MRRIVMIALLSSTIAHAQAPGEEEKPKPTPYDRGRMSIAFGVGQQTGLDPSKKHIYVAGGFGYFVLKGFETSLHGIYLFGAEPSISMLSPQLRYVFVQVPGSVKPYLGTFYNHWFIGSDIDDVETGGARAGIIIGTSGILIPLGAAFEHTLSECTMDCNDVYPEVGLGFTF